MNSIPVRFIGCTLSTDAILRLTSAHFGRNFKDFKSVAISQGGRKRIRESYAEVEAKLDREIGNRPLIVGGHSLGAILAAMYAANRPNVKLTVAIDGPFAGTMAASPSMLIPGVTERIFPAALDWVPGSPFMQWLSKELPKVHDRMVCAYSPWDGLVWPGESGNVIGARRTIRLPKAINHLSAVIYPPLLRAFKEEYARIEESHAMLLAS